MVVVAALTAVPLFATAGPKAEETTIWIGTGSVVGVYFPVGGEICRMVNRAYREDGLRCSVESTDGSVFNLNGVRDGDFDLAIAQSDRQFDAWKGKGAFAAQGPDKNLRSVFSLYPEAVTLVARSDSGITSVVDIKGKRVSIGGSGSGTRAIVDALFDALGMTKDDLQKALELKPADQAKALCNNEIDAFFFPVGFPSGSVSEALGGCESVLVPIEGEAIDKLVEQNSYYAKAVIPGAAYGLDYDTPTYGVKATLVTSSNLDEDTVYKIVKVVFDNLDTFRDSHPALAGLNAKDMIADGMTAPIHPGAARYFLENGMM
jgi:TRAP transporter TAXI family solute receptor